MPIRNFRFSMDIRLPDDMHEEDILELLHDEIKQATGCLSVGNFEAIKPLEEADIPKFPSF